MSNEFKAIQYLVSVNPTRYRLDTYRKGMYIQYEVWERVCCLGAFKLCSYKMFLNQDSFYD